MLAGVTRFVSGDNGFAVWLEGELDDRNWRPAEIARVWALPEGRYALAVNGENARWDITLTCRE
jgi:hypothetical protein